MDTVTLGHFPAPTITAETAPDLKSAGKTALTSSKAFGKFLVYYSSVFLSSQIETGS